jgi:hypothetical protein
MKELVMAESRTTGRATGNPETTRPTRDDEIRQERRRRQPGSLDRSAHLKLAIPENVRAENADQQLRWINDVGNRMHHLTVIDDYSKVAGVDPVPVGTSDDGKPIYAHLCAKPLDYWKADQREKTAAISASEKGLLQGDRTSAEDRRSEDVSYVPKGNSIARA